MDPEKPRLRGTLIDKEKKERDRLRGTLIDEQRNWSKEYLEKQTFLQRDDSEHHPHTIVGWKETSHGKRVTLRDDRGKTITLVEEDFIEKLRSENGSWKIKE